jgi:hypothetical protein
MISKIQQHKTPQTTPTITGTIEFDPTALEECADSAAYEIRE